MPPEILTALIAALTSLVVSLVAVLLNRNKTNAEIEKIKAETTRIVNEPLDRIKEIEEEQTKRIRLFEADLNQKLEKTGLLRQTRWQLRYDACLEALNLVDAMYSNMNHFRNGVDISGTIVKQPVTTQQVRMCASKLIVSCNQAELIDCFFKICEANDIRPADIANIRRLVRKELWEEDVENLNIPDLWIYRVEGDPEPVDEEAWNRLRQMQGQRE